MKYKSYTISCCGDQLHKLRAYAWRAVIFRPGYKHFLTSNFADGKNIQLTIRILSRPTLWITVTETIVKAQRSLRWEIETMEVESRSHWGQTILLSACSTSTSSIATARTETTGGPTYVMATTIGAYHLAKRFHLSMPLFVLPLSGSHSLHQWTDLSNDHIDEGYCMS